MCPEILLYIENDSKLFMCSPKGTCALMSVAKVNETHRFVVWRIQNQLVEDGDR